MKTKLSIFIVLVSTFFLFAEDFWMKLGFEDAADKMHYSSQDEIYINSNADEYRSFDKGYTWENYPDVLGYPFGIYGVEYISDDGNYLYVRSVDSLCIVHKDSSNLKPLLDLGFMSMSKVKGNFYFLTGGRIIKADENLNDTTIVLETDVSTEPFFALVSDSAGTLYAGSTDYMYEGGLYRSYDDGETWIGPGPDLLDDFIKAMSVDSEGRIFVGTSGHGILGGGRIYRSEDNGDSWQEVAGDGVYVWSMLINSDDEIFAGLSDDWGFLGIAYSDDNGDTWSFLNEGLGGATSEGGAGGITDISISPDGYVYLATDGGVYRSVESTTGIESQVNLISEYKLHQNYPNPFNPVTQIKFALPTAGNVKLNVYNITGQLVSELVNGSREAVIHMVNFDGSNLNSGMYFYTLNANGITITKKMMLSK